MAINNNINSEKNYFPAESKNSTESTFILFEARQAYEEITLPYILTKSKYAIPINDSYINNALYGFIDLDGDAIQPINILNNFKSFGNIDGTENKIQNFVADAYFEMKLFLNNAISQQNISENTIFTNLQIYNNYEDYDRLYRNYHFFFAKEFKDKSLDNNLNNSKIKDHKSFIKYYTKFLKSKLKNLPVTKSSTMIYFNFFTFPSGLVFDIAKDKADNDEIKFNNYFTDPIFNVFSEACLRFGFNIDKNIPWRLNANLNSPAMQPYLRKYGISNIQNLFSTRYKKIFFDDVKELKELFYRAYIIFIDNNLSYEPSYKDICGNKITLYERKSVTYQEFIKDFPNQFWVRLYTYFKNYETQKNLTQVQFDNIVREANELVKIGNIDSALIYLNNYFKDYKLVSGFNKNLTLIDNVPELATNDTGYDIIL
jgi:hypothetical protein